ncbi:MAG: DUF4142 domain-containing protein [Verrucomicrobiota bacterium]
MTFPKIGPACAGLALGISGVAGATLWATEAATSPSITSGGSPAQMGSPAGSTVNQQDTKFLNDIAKANATQIAYGFLAIEKGSTDNVKKFGRDLIDNRVKSTKNLMELASRKNMFIPLADVMKQNTDQLNQLGQQPGAEFDKALIKTVISDNAKMQANLQRYLSQVQDTDLRDFANQCLSDVGDRLSDARDLGSNLGIAAQDLNPTLPPVAEEPTAMPAPRLGASPSP